MTNELQGKRIAFLATDGVERSELEQPWKEIQAAGAETTLLSIKGGEIQAVTHGEKSGTFPVDALVASADPDGFDALVVPGGVRNPDRMRTDRDAVEFVKAFVEAGKPTAVICHGPWMLVEADVLRGRTVTSWPSLRTDIRNAGGDWVDEEVVVDSGLVTSRNPDDLPAFCAKAIEEIAEGAHGAGSAHRTS
jgi:deglycase